MDKLRKKIRKLIEEAIIGQNNVCVMGQITKEEVVGALKSVGFNAFIVDPEQD